MTAPRRRNMFVGLTGVLALMFAGLVQARQQAGEPAHAVVTEAEAMVRSGPYQSYYPFGKLQAGDVVEVIGELRGWARVRTAGPAFEEFFGYIRYAKSRADKVRLEADGKTGTALGRIDILAPNLATQNPNESWRTIARANAGEKVTILDTIESDRDIIHKVALPDAAEGWVSVAQLRAATNAEVSAWRRAIAGSPPAQPTPAASDPPGPAETTSPPVLPTQEETLPAASDPTATGQPTIADPPATTPDPAATVDPTPVTNDTTDADSADPPAETTDAGAADTGKPDPDIDPDIDRFEALEAAYQTLSTEPIETAEVTPLRDLYQELADRTENKVVRAYAETRAEQLQIWSELQASRSQLLAARARTKMSAEEAATTRMMLEAAGRYEAVGRLASSTIYDGKRLPRLMRLQDPATSRTIAYVKPSETFDLVSMLGQLIGVHGETAYDGSLRLNIVTPSRIDILTATEGGE